ncbi:NAD-dependent epimerase/dehydratase family protein [Bacillus alveayuensis]|uniref:NAD-dependent epimerase/dehydratase family protein n=1 Tax=Aeribacillus alveayuensis TaxID=279215 RepID=UPI0005CDA109|nr:NAD(P)-dependent oxidoreductase [Bacillus alveayuensis]
MKKETKILITGCTGFIGSKIINELLQYSNVKIIGIGRKEKINNDNIKYYSGDICDNHLLEKVFDENAPIDYVFHLAAIVHNNLKDAEYEDYYKINYLASKNLFEKAKSHNVKHVIFFSTVEVYENSRKDFNCLNEEVEVKPTSNYAKTKFLAEKSLEQLNIPYTILRLAPVYDRDFLLNISKRVSLLKNRIFVEITGYNFKYSLLACQNILKVTKEILKDNNSFIGVYNLADEKIYSQKDIINYIKSIEKKPALNIKVNLRVIEMILDMIEKIADTIFKNNIFKVSNLYKMKENRIYSVKKIREVGIKLKNHLVDV